MSFLSYFFWPRPPQMSYDNPKLQAAIAVCFALVALSFVLKIWRRKLRNPQTKKLSRSWPSAAMWFGVTGLLLAVSRGEDISYLSMRFLWVVWAAVFVLYALVQVRMFRAKHYETLPKQEASDPRDKYLPGRGKKRK